MERLLKLPPLPSLLSSAPESYAASPTLHSDTCVRPKRYKGSLHAEQTSTRVVTGPSTQTLKHRPIHAHWLAGHIVP